MEQVLNSAIADQCGWDVLFFAGHSNETVWRRCEMGIAPGMSISINEIATQLSLALATIVPFQDFLLDGRVYSQAVYRNLTQQIAINFHAIILRFIENRLLLLTRRGCPADYSYSIR